MRDKKRGLPVFWICLSVYALLLFCGIAVFANALNSKLTVYESKQVKYAAEAVFEEFFGGDLERVAKEYGESVSAYEKSDSYLLALKNRVDKESLSYSKMSEEEGKHIFSVFDKNGEIAQYILSQTEDKKWLLEDIDLFISPENTVTVTVQKGSEVKINGVTLKEELIMSEDSTHPSNSYDFPEENCEGIQTVTYYLDGLYLKPEVKVTDRFKNDAAVTEESENVYVSPVVYDTHRLEEVEERILNAAEEYCRYMYRDASLTDIMIYIDRSDELYAYLKSLTEYWSEEGERREYTEKSVTDLYFYSENVFSCKVKFIATLDEEVDEIELDLLFYRADKAWMLDTILN